MTGIECRDSLARFYKMRNRCSSGSLCLSDQAAAYSRGAMSGIGQAVACFVPKNSTVETRYAINAAMYSIQLRWKSCCIAVRNIGSLCLSLFL